ncbi:MAG: glycosyltransferase family 4 protein [Limnohabitans sp.]
MQFPPQIQLAFNGVSLLSPLTGIGQYTANVAQRIASSTEVDARFFYGAGWSSQVQLNTSPVIKRFLPWFRKHIPWSYEIRQWTQSQRFQAGIRSAQFDLYHEPNNVPLPFDGPMVLTVHDLSWVRFPEMHPIERVRAMDKYFESGLRRASRVLTDSQFVKQELIDVFGLGADIIHSVGLGVEARFRPLSQALTWPVLSKFNLQHGAYFLAVGTLEPRKNLQIALEAFLALSKVVRQRHPMVLVGMTGWHASPLEAKLAPLLASGEVRQLGYLSREDLAVVVAGACALVYPSVYEGFGLPPLEAMTCGVPVIASNVSSIPEVVGDTGVLVSPQDVKGLADAMTMMLSAADVRASLSARALIRSQSFSWDLCARETIEVYKAAIA